MEAIRPHPNINQWADLPKDLLFRIIKYLDLKTDLPRVRGVCPTWRSALPLAELSMCKSHIQVPSLGEGDSRPLFLHESKFYFFRPLPTSAHGSVSSSDDINTSAWIARMVETGTNKWHLINPFASHHLDYFVADPPITGEINLLDFRVLELARTLSLVPELDYKGSPISKKIVGEWDLKSSDCFVVLVLLEKNKGGGLLMLKSGDREWVKIDATSDVDKLQNKKYDVLDIAFHNGKFYFIQMSYGTWRVGIINPGDCSKSLQFKWGFCSILEDAHLVQSQSNESLYLLFNESKYSSRAYRPYKVYLMKEQEGYVGSEWKPVDNLGDEILFIGDSVSFILHNSALNQIPHWNSISLCHFSTGRFIIDLLDRSYCFPEGAECLNQIKCWSYNKFSACFAMKKDARLLEKVSEDQEVSKRLFFPPPSWVKWHCPSVETVEVKFDDLIYPVESDYDSDDFGYDYIFGGLTESDDNDDDDDHFDIDCFRDYYTL